MCPGCIWPSIVQLFTEKAAIPYDAGNTDAAVSGDAHSELFYMEIVRHAEYVLSVDHSSFFGRSTRHLFASSIYEKFAEGTVQLYEAAVMDGYSPPGIFWKIYLPLCKPALAALSVFTFMGAWNNTVRPLIYLQDKKLFTLPLGLLYLKGNSEVDTSLLMAVAVIITIPVVAVYLIAQKQFVQGIASTGLKG